ncbi:hypothetical protein ACQP2E_12045 [Actinoplanes sp. CA-015351]|uniref:hypothetical protein n=1 Tax=Actinoplanes sp. CA-015351 TaxID=3239897 RepID=UPI003D96ED09
MAFFRKKPPPAPRKAQLTIRRAPDPEVPGQRLPEHAAASAPAGSGTLARFPRPTGALTCWAQLRAIAGQGIDVEARRAPDGSLWLRAPVPPDTATGIVWACGGEPYADHSAFPGYTPVPLLELLSAVPGRAQESATARHELILLVNGPVANHVIRRSIGAGAEVHYQQVKTTQAGPDQKPGPAVLIRVIRAGGLPRSLVRTLTQLPQTVVGEPYDQEQRLIVALDHRLPIEPADLLGEIPQDERWVIGGLDGGSWLVPRSEGNWYSADELYSSDGLSAAPGLPQKRSSFVPQGITVRLVRDATNAGRPDAVLIDDADLENLRVYLTGRPLGETGYLTPGPGCFLIQQPGGLVADLPFGSPLRRIGPGGLYLADGHRLHPTIPASGRQTLFAVARRTAVVISDGTVRRFSLDDAVPIWALWAAELPEVRAQVSGSAKDILRRLDGLLDARPPVPSPDFDTDVSGAERSELHRDALIAQNDDDPIRAAGLLQQAGDFAAAARLLEAAALGRGDA